MKKRQEDRNYLLVTQSEIYKLLIFGSYGDSRSVAYQSSTPGREEGGSGSGFTYQGLASSITKGQCGGNGQILATPSDMRSVDSQHRVEVSVPAGHGVPTMLCLHTQMESRPDWIVFDKPLARQVSRLSVGLLALCSSRETKWMVVGRGGGVGLGVGMQTLPYETFFPEIFRFGAIEIVAQNFEVWNSFHSRTKEGERLTRKSSRGTGSVAKSCDLHVLPLRAGRKPSDRACHLQGWLFRNV